MLVFGSCSFTFQLNFLYFVNSLWKSAFNKKDHENVDDTAGFWDSASCCFGLKAFSICR